MDIDDDELLGLAQMTAILRLYRESHGTLDVSPQEVAAWGQSQGLFGTVQPTEADYKTIERHIGVSRKQSDK